jgi:hypothetical protein
LYLSATENECLFFFFFFANCSLRRGRGRIRIFQAQNQLDMIKLVSFSAASALVRL